jgi:predicted alpha/beta-fold hydrolase
MGFYNKTFLLKYKKNNAMHAQALTEMFSEKYGIDVVELFKKLKNATEIDDIMISRVNGYKDRYEYYYKASAVH